MQVPIPAFLHRFWHSYTPLQQDSETGDEGNTSRLYIRPAWNSKRLRTVIIGCVLFFVLVLTLTRLRSWTPSQHLITTNAEVLDEVANSVDWHRFAYVQYVTNSQYLCNSLMLFEILDRLKCRSDRLMMFPGSWTTEVDSDRPANDETRLLRLARDKYAVHLQPIEVQSKWNGDRKIPKPGC